MIYDLSNPANPVFLRDWAMDGQQPGGKLQPHFTDAPSIHGPISTGPAGGALSAIPGVVANRVYFAYGTGSTGIMQVVDRSKLLPPPYGTGANLTDYTSAELGHLVIQPENGAHTSFPIGNITVPDFVVDTGNTTAAVRDIVVVTSEAGGLVEYQADRSRLEVIREAPPYPPLPLLVCHGRHPYLPFIWCPPKRINSTPSRVLVRSAGEDIGRNADACRT